MHILIFSMLITANNGTVTSYKWILNVWLHKIYFSTEQKQKISILTILHGKLIMFSAVNEIDDFTWMNDQMPHLHFHSNWSSLMGFLCVEAILLLYPIQQSNEQNRTVKRIEMIISRIIAVRWQDNTTVLKVQWPIQFRCYCCYYYWVLIIIWNENRFSYRMTFQFISCAADFDCMR